MILLISGYFPSSHVLSGFNIGSPSLTSGESDTNSGTPEKFGFLRIVALLPSQATILSFSRSIKIPWANALTSFGFKISPNTLFCSS